MHAALGLLTMFPGRVGGAETNVRGLLGEFSAGQGPEHVTVLANRHVAASYGEYVRGPVTIREVRAYRPGNRDATRLGAMLAGGALARALGAHVVPREADVLHLPVTVPIPRTRKPTVVTLLDVQHHELPQMFSHAERAFRAWAYDRAARQADQVVTISHHAREGIVDRLGIDPAHVRTIPLGVDHARFSPDGPMLDGLPERYVVYPANLWPHKNHARLLDAFARVCEHDPDLSLLLTGQTYGRDMLVAGRERVRHLGHVPHDQLPDILRGARALVFPSLFEGFGLPPLEAMACGTPVAASNRGAIAEVCGDAALCFDPEDVDAMADAIERIASDESLRASLREAGLARAAAYTWRAAANAHVDVYREVTQKAAAMA